MKKKIYITTSNFHIKKNKLESLFSKKKFKVIKACIGRKYKETEIIHNFKDAYAIIAGTEKYTPAVLKSLKDLKYISRCGVGTDSIDLVAIKKNKIKLLKTKDSHIYIVAEHAIAGMFAILKNIVAFNLELKNKIWKKKNVATLFKKNIGFYGYGRIAKQIHNNLINSGSNFLYYDLNDNDNDKKIKRVKTLKSLFKYSDIIFICASLINNKYSINKKILNSNKEKKIIINTSRGELINDKDLIQYLKKNKESSYFSDVFNKEPYHGPMTNLPNAIFTPHVATYEPYFRLNMELECVENLSKIIK